MQQRADRGQWTLLRATQLHEVRHALKNLVRSEQEAPESPGRPLLAAVEERLSLVFSELGTNALRYGAGPVTASLARGDGQWLVTVSDGAPEALPLPRSPSAEQEGGRGLHLVAAMSENFGWYADEDCKHVWALIADAPPTELLQTLQNSRRP